jgi:hypothetical protein
MSSAASNRLRLARERYLAFGAGVLTFDDQHRIVRTEVYFGWNLEP